MLSVALRAPVAAGVNATATVQVTAGARGEAQVLSCAKEVGLVPEIEMEVMFAVVAPELVRVTI